MTPGVRSGFVPAALSRVALTACGEGPPPTTLARTDTLPGGRVRVTNLGPAWTPGISYPGMGEGEIAERATTRSHARTYPSSNRSSVGSSATTRGTCTSSPSWTAHPAGSVVDAFTTDGLYLGRMAAPDRIRLPLPAPHATRDHLYVIVRDEFDVPYVSRLRIVRPDP